jgi:hypothetical protein
MLSAELYSEPTVLHANSAALVLVLCASARAATPPAENVDVEAVKSELRVFDDGKGNYLALIPFGSDMWSHFYWGDGKVFWTQRVVGGRSEGDISFEKVFWDPRVPRAQASLWLKEGVYTLGCGERTTVFKPTPPEQSTTLLASATFKPPRWKRRAYALARDESGTYYYVDRARDEDVKDFRLWTGLRGQLKPLKMTNVVSDSEGDIFATRTGELRLVLDKNESYWVKGKARTALKLLPLEDNVRLIYSELGVYAGEPLGTPCDLL